MYRAVQDQLSLRSKDEAQQPDDTMQLRKKTADYIRNHRDDFLPFLIQVCKPVAEIILRHNSSIKVGLKQRYDEFSTRCDRPLQYRRVYSVAVQCQQSAC